MFDIGWQELFVIGLVTVIVVGPKELPRVLRSVTHAVRKMRAMAAEFQNSLNDLAREADLEDMKRDLQKAGEFDFRGEMEKTIDPTGEVRRTMRSIGDTAREEKASIEDDGRRVENALDSPTVPTGPDVAATSDPDTSKADTPQPDTAEPHAPRPDARRSGAA